MAIICRHCGVDLSWNRTWVDRTGKDGDHSREGDRCQARPLTGHRPGGDTRYKLWHRDATGEPLSLQLVSQSDIDQLLGEAQRLNSDAGYDAWSIEPLL